MESLEKRSREQVERCLPEPAQPEERCRRSRFRSREYLVPTMNAGMKEDAREVFSSCHPVSLPLCKLFVFCLLPSNPTDLPPTRRFARNCRCFGRFLSEELCPTLYARGGILVRIFKGKCNEKRTPRRNAQQRSSVMDCESRLYLSS